MNKATCLTPAFSGSTLTDDTYPAVYSHMLPVAAAAADCFASHHRFYRETPERPLCHIKTGCEIQTSMLRRRDLPCPRGATSSIDPMTKCWTSHFQHISRFLSRVKRMLTRSSNHLTFVLHSASNLSIACILKSHILDIYKRFTRSRSH